jgi:pyrrolysine biosynthesis protein PylD
MTRLKEEDLEPIAGNLLEYDIHLKRIVGAPLRQIACYGAGVDESLMESLLGRMRFAAVPIRSGLGVIRGFSQAVVSIVSHLGFDAFVTEGSDVSGVAEGIERGADILLLADDERFVALVSGLRQVVDNSPATARGFVAGLELMKGGLEGESVLVLGCGPVGLGATTALIERGAEVALCDIRQGRARAAIRGFDRKTPDRIKMEEHPRAAVERYELIFDATDSGGFIEPADLTAHALVAAPGIPCALTSEAMAKHGDRVLHDSLQIGTATMAVQAAMAVAPRAKPPSADRA